MLLSVNKFRYFIYVDNIVLIGVDKLKMRIFKIYKGYFRKVEVRGIVL